MPPIEHCHVGPAENGWIRVKYEEPRSWDARGGPYDGRVGFVDREGRVLIPALPYGWVGERWSEGSLAVRHQGRYGFIDRSGREVIAPRFEEASFFVEGLARVKLGGKWGFVDPTGAVKIRFRYEWDAGTSTRGWPASRSAIGPGSSTGTGSSPFRRASTGTGAAIGLFAKDFDRPPQGGKWGYIDRTGTFVIPPSFDEAWAFSEGLAAVSRDKLWGSSTARVGWSSRPATSASIPDSTGALPS